MIATSLSALHLLEPRRKTKFISLVILRALSGLLDLLAVLLLGALVSLIAVYSSQTGPTSSNLLNLFVGDLDPLKIKDLIVLIAAGTIFSFLLKAFLSAWLTRQTTSFLADCEILASNALAQRVTQRKLHGIEMQSSTELIFAIKQGTHATFGGLLQNMATLIAESFLFVSLALVFLIVSPATTAVLLTVMTIIGAILHFYVGKRIQINSQKATLASQEIDDSIHNLVSGFREIYSAGATGTFLKLLAKNRDTFARVEANQVFLQALPRYVIETAVILLILSIGLVQVVQVDISETASTLGVFLAGGMRIVAAMVPLQAALGQLRHFVPEANLALSLFAKLGLSHIGDVEKVPRNVNNNSVRKPVSMAFNKVSFSYSKTPNFKLNSIEINVPAGHHVALVGRSGSGKSTIADLTLGLLDPQVGEIKIGSWRADQFVQMNPGRVGYVPQKPLKFPGDFIDNVALGIREHEVNISKVISSLRLANLFDFVNSLPDSINTDLSKTKLSGGQLQRLGLARALYANPQLLVLDEVTASLDVESERGIAESLEKLKGKVTVLIIAHRISTIKNSDNIYVLDSGHIRESGDFNRLSSQGKNFKKFLDNKR